MQKTQHLNLPPHQTIIVYVHHAKSLLYGATRITSAEYRYKDGRFKITYRTRKPQCKATVFFKRCFFSYTIFQGAGTHSIKSLYALPTKQTKAQRKKESQFKKLKDRDPIDILEGMIALAMHSTELRK